MEQLVSRIVLVASLVAGAGLAAPGPAWACSCEMLTEAEAVATHRVVFAGTLSGVRATGAEELTYGFDVDTVVKGDVPERILMTNSVDHSNSCSERLAAGKRYLVFGDDPRKLSHSACSPTKVIGSRTVAGLAPRPGGEELPPDRSWLVWPAVGAAVIGGWLLVRRLKDPLKR